MEDTTSYDTGGSLALPVYISCKEVRALKIKDITQTETEAVLHFEDPRYAPRVMATDWVDKRGAKPGGYFIVYEDGYTSWSPAEAFERSNTPKEEWGIPVTQERKYGVNLRGKLFNRETGREVTCPVFMVLAKDSRGVLTVIEYRGRVPGTDHGTIRALNTVLEDFGTYRDQHPDTMKAGDTAPPREAWQTQPATWAAGERENPST